MTERVSSPDHSLFAEGVRNIPKELSRMGFKALRDGQQQPVYRLMSGIDTICVLPTSLGKSLIYMLTAVCMKWKCVVFSPLISLMQDQVESAWEKGIKAAQLSSGQTDAENEAVIRAWLAGEIQILYTAPERITSDNFKRAMQQVPPEFVAIDEAHVCSQWSDNFRHHYVLIGDFIDETQPRVVGAFTATCDADIEQDMRRVYRMPDAYMWKFMPPRDNLKYQSVPWFDYSEMARRIKSIKNGSVIVYCATIKELIKTAQNLQGLLPEENVTVYHGELPPSTKSANMKMFMNGTARVVVATNAFGMGVDKSDVRAVFHRQFPGTPEALAQELGRGGRDGKPCLCLTYDDPDTKRTHDFFIDNGNPPESLFRSFFRLMELESGKGKRPVRMLVKEMAQRLGCFDRQLSSVIETMSGHGVIKRVHEKDAVARVKILQTQDDKRFGEYMEYIETSGEVDSSGFYSVNLQWLADQVGVTLATITRHLKNWNELDWIEYEKPYSGDTTYLTGGIHLVDFERLAHKRERDKRKLAQVMKYLSLPDDEKSDWLQSHFAG